MIEYYGKMLNQSHQAVQISPKNLTLRGATVVIATVARLNAYNTISHNLRDRVVMHVDVCGYKAAI